METQTRALESTSPLTGRSYPIPASLDERNNLDSFIASHPGKRVVVVQGLGFVGAVMAIVCANASNEDYAVIGVDLATENTYWKLVELNSGIFPIVASDPKIQEFYEKAREQNNFYASCDPYAYSLADVVVIDINLDVEKRSSPLGELQDFDVDLAALRSAVTSIGANCRADVQILVETTVPPGTSETVVAPTLEKALTKRNLPIDQYVLGHSYERVMPGPNYVDSIMNFYRVYAGVDERSAQATEKFLRTFISTEEYPLTRLGSTTATEMAKVLENSYRAMNIAFMVEWSRFAEESGVNLYEVVDAIRMRPTHQNLMYPGIGVGGYCLTKDPLLASWSKTNFFNSTEPLQQSEIGVHINDQMPRFAFDYMVQELGESLAGKKVSLLGVSYRSDVGDTRFTPVDRFYDLLVQEKAIVSLHDPHVRLWEEKDLNVEAKLEVVLSEPADVVVICTNHSEYKSSAEMINLLMARPAMLILDTVGVLSDAEIANLKAKHQVRVVGRGDLT